MEDKLNSRGFNSVSEKVVFKSHPPLNPPASGGKCFLHMQTIYPVYTLAKGKNSILPPRSRGWLGWGDDLFAIHFPTGS